MHCEIDLGLGPQHPAMRGADPLPDKRLAEVRPVNHRVAADARCNRRRSCAHPMHCACGNRAVALVAERGDRWHVQEARILRAMWRMAGHAPFRPYRRVLKHKWSARFGMAFGAHRVLIRSRPHVVCLEGAMHVVAITAGHQSLVDPVMEWHIERWLHIGMALVAKLRL